MRRDKNDIQWQKTKEFIFNRDGYKCRFITVLSPKELELLYKENPNNLYMNQFDPAHIFPVSTDLKNCYNEKNIVSLCRYCHSCLDLYKSPITGNNLNKNQLYYYWWRILTIKTVGYKDEIDYVDLCKKLINT